MSTSSADEICEKGSMTWKHTVQQPHYTQHGERVRMIRAGGRRPKEFTGEGSREL